MDTKLRRKKQYFLYMLIKERENIQKAIDKLEIELSEHKLGEVDEHYGQ